MFMLLDTESQVIDSYTLTTDETAPVVTQGDDPGENLMTIGGVKLPELPSPTVGGENGSRDQNGFSTGFRSLFTRQQPFSGATASFPRIENAVQGQVGDTNRASRLYVGVMDQMQTYQAAENFALKYVGAMPLPAPAGSK